jgi:Uncharacterized ACR, COG1993
MNTIGTALHVRIYIGESDKWRHKPLYMAIVEMLRQEDCARATVTRGLAGFGEARRIHAASEANRLIKAHTETDERLHFIDLTEAIMGPDGQPDRSLFRLDRLYIPARRAMPGGSRS